MTLTYGTLIPVFCFATDLQPRWGYQRFVPQSESFLLVTNILTLQFFVTYNYEFLPVQSPRNAQSFSP
jgi:hypothetical protein